MNYKADKRINATLAKQILKYDPTSGIIRYTKSDHGVVAGQRAGCKSSAGYRTVVFKKVSILEHRLAWFLHHGAFPIKHLDHINGQKDDNRMANLRQSCGSTNQMNAGPQRNNKCGVKGVYFCKHRKLWVASICKEGKRKHIGRYPTLKQAKCAREKAETEIFREFANTSLNRA